MEAETKFFYDLTPDVVLTAVETFGFRCTGRILALNSMENRVYEVEVECEDDLPPASRERFRIVKFYRPGRWSLEQIEEEHKFTFDLLAAEVPAVTPLKHDGESVRQAKDTGIFYSVFEKAPGRNPDELNDEQLLWIGRLVGRMHNVGAQEAAHTRIDLDIHSYALDNLDFLIEAEKLPEEFEHAYEDAVEDICDLCEPMFEGVPTHRIHGDCHFGNILWGSAGPFFVDFDDMVNGPAVQDLWLLAPGRDKWGRKQRETLLAGYEQMRAFDYSSFRLIEPLRTLRMINFSSWIARRWEDPAFPKAFPYFGTQKYWREQLTDLLEQRELIRGILRGEVTS